MAHSAHLVTTGATPYPMVTIRDDAGATVTEWPADPELELSTIDGQLRSAGWARSDEWTTSDEGWTAPVTHS